MFNLSSLKPVIHKPRNLQPDKAAADTPLTAMVPPVPMSRRLGVLIWAWLAVGLAAVTIQSPLLRAQQPEDQPTSRIVDPDRSLTGPIDDQPPKPGADAADRSKSIADVIDQVQGGIVLITVLDSSGRQAGLGSGGTRTTLDLLRCR